MLSVTIFNGNLKFFIFDVEANKNTKEEEERNEQDKNE